MSDKHKRKPKQQPHQKQGSLQSLGTQASGKHAIRYEEGSGRSEPAAEQLREPRTGMGASQGQDRASTAKQKGGRPHSPERSDIERDVPPENQEDSIVGEMGGAFKERP